jgi:hypothetical protein
MTSTERPIHPLISSAPDLFAWAGSGSAVRAIHESGDLDAMNELRARVSDAYYDQATSYYDDDYEDTIYDVHHIDVEAIAAGILSERETQAHNPTAYHVSNLGAYAPDRADGATIDMKGTIHLPGSSWTDAALEASVARDYAADEEWAEEDWAERCQRNADLTTAAEARLAEWNEARLAAR